MKRLAKWLAFLGVALLMLLAVVFLFAQTPIFKNWLRGQIEQKASESLGADLRIGRLQGDLIGNVILSDVALSEAGHLLFETEKLLVRYNLASLWRRTLRVHELRLLRPHVVFDQAPSGELRWRQIFQRLSAPSSATVSDTIQATAWRLDLPAVEIDRGRIDIDVTPRPSYAPRTIDPLNFSGSVFVHGDTVRVRVREIDLVSREPSLRLRSSPFQVAFHPEALSLTEFEVVTDSSKLVLEVEVEEFENPRGRVKLQTRPLSFAEVTKLLPRFPLHGTATLDLELVGDLDRLRLRSHLHSGSGRIQLEGILGLRAPSYRYQLIGRLDRLDAGGLLARPEWSSDLSLTFDLKGEGTELPGAVSDVRVRISESRFAGREIRSGRFTLALRKDSLSVQTEMQTSAGAVTFVGEASRLSEEPLVHGELSLQTLNIGQLLGVDTLETSLSGTLQASGYLTRDTSFVGSVAVDLGGSGVQELQFDKLTLRAALAPGDVVVDTVLVQIQEDTFSGRGRLSRIADSDFRFAINLPDLRPLRRWLWSEEVEATVRVDGKVSGRLDRAVVDGRYEVEDYEDGTISARYVEGTYHLERRDTVFVAEALAQASGIVAAGLALDELEGRVVAYPDRLELEADGTGFGLSHLKIAGTLVPADTSIFRVRDLRAELDGQTWACATEQAQVRFWDSSVVLENVELTSGRQRIRVHGLLSTENEENFNLFLSDVQLEPVLQAIVGDVGVSGTLDAELHLLGTADRPQLTGFLLLQDGGVADFRVDSLYARVNYDDEKLGWQLRMVKDTSQVLTSSGFLPVDLAFEAAGPRVLDRPMEVYINTGGMDLAFLEPFFERIEELEGRIAAHIVLENTPFSPRGRGPITVYDGAFTLPDYGIRLRKIAIRAQLDGTKAIINQFKMESGPGRLEGTGALSLSREGLDQFALELTASNFEIMRNEMMRANLNGKLRLTGSLQQPRMEGEVTLANATLFLEGFEEEPALIATNSSGTSPLFSLGVDTLVIRKEEVTEVVEEPKVAEERRTIGPRFDPYERLRGRLKVHIPRNTWVRGGAANFEIEGTIELVKDGPDFVFFGPVEIVRGTYEVAGNRFQITEGRIVFQGEEDYNAQVHLIAEYRFTTLRDGERMVQTLKMVIEGTVFQPKLSFFHEDQEIEEKDFLAYLFFGQPFDALLSGEQSQLSSEALSQRATSLFGGLLAQQLGKTLGEAFRLDIVDIRREGAELEQTTVSVGKYIAPNLFLSLSQDFAGGQRVAVEYEVFRRFFIQMVREQLARQQEKTAFDVIWKVDW